MITDLLVKARNARWVWDLFGPVYNRRIYDALCELYEHIADAVLRHEPSRILDIGAGPGYVTLLLAARSPSAAVTGIDFSAMQVRSAQRLQKRRGVGNCRFEQANAMRLPYADDHFDAVVTVGSIKHWPDPQRGVAEMHRVLSPGRWALISETDRDVPEAALGRFVERFTAWYFWDALLYWGLRRVIFGRSYTEQQIAAFARNAGFRDIQTDRVPASPYVIVMAKK